MATLFLLLLACVSPSFGYNCSLTASGQLETARGSTLQVNVSDNCSAYLVEQCNSANNWSILLNSDRSLVFTYKGSPETVEKGGQPMTLGTTTVEYEDDGTITVNFQNDVPMSQICGICVAKSMASAQRQIFCNTDVEN